MVEELTKVDINEFNEVLENISVGLKQAAQGYDNLRTLLPQLPVHAVPKLVETVPAIYTQPLPAPLISMLTEMGPKEAMYSIIRNKVAEGTAAHQLWTAYGLTCSMTMRALKGEGYKGSTWYRHHKQLASMAEEDVEVDTLEVKKKKRKRKCKSIITEEIN